MAGRAARSGAVHSAASAITFSTAATTALPRRIRGSIATTVSPSLHFRSACADKWWRPRPRSIGRRPVTSSTRRTPKE
ncbi:hypothetical protein PR202_gb04186 [Eleusine coracana subsp. coracana]|uniref:Secreted protein n=1 Tax=Eleusine coracana subsp. coracana TaxID=191504 RepID=A0AAV5E3V1_ELECO|nr:hypothetical protein PR202_gb04186 [Eleusine coracana subsp. coracana]